MKCNKRLLGWLGIVALLAMTAWGCRETKRSKLLRKIEQEGTFDIRYLDTTVVYDSVSGKEVIKVEEKTLEDVHISTEEYPVMLREDGSEASVFETKRLLNYFIDKHFNPPAELTTGKRKRLIVELYFDKTGRIVKVGIMNPTYTVIDTMALAAFHKMKKRFRWTPAYLAGDPINFKMVVPLSY